jgi:hypothetical protein
MIRKIKMAAEPCLFKGTFSQKVAEIIALIIDLIPT